MDRPSRFYVSTVAMSRTPRKLRVLSYNIHKGFSAGNRRFVLARIKEAIRSVHADVVFLQEVLGEHADHAEKVAGWPSESQFEYLADSVWHHYAYGKNAVYTSGHHGNAILSKYPIVGWENLDISMHRFERRGILHAQVDVPGHRLPVHCLCLHFGLSEKGRIGQIERLVHRVDQAVPQTEPLLIAGDFNDWSRRATVALEREVDAHEVYRRIHGSHPKTFPSRFPLLPLDRIYSRGFHVETAQVMVGKPWNTLSDHAALYAELSWVEDI